MMKRTKYLIICMLVCFLGCRDEIMMKNENPGPGIKVYHNLDRALNNPLDVEELILYDSTLTEIPAAIRTLQNLVYLTIHNAQITTLPEELTELPNLTEVIFGQPN